jgi:hypothetical protein
MEDRNLKAILPGIVLQILGDNSGGMKLTALVAEVLSVLHAKNRELPPNFAEDFETLLASMQPYNIHLLDYQWDMNSGGVASAAGMGTGPIRSKTFVYTKFR